MKVNGEKFRHRRIHELGRTQAKAAALGGITEKTLRGHESGVEREPQYDTIEALAKAISVTTDEFRRDYLIADEPPGASADPRQMSKEEMEEWMQSLSPRESLASTLFISSQTLAKLQASRVRHADDPKALIEIDELIGALRASIDMIGEMLKSDRVQEASKSFEAARRLDTAEATIAGKIEPAKPAQKNAAYQMKNKATGKRRVEGSKPDDPR